METSPLNCKVTWALSCLVPISVVKSLLLCEKKFKFLIETSYEGGWIQSVVGDRNIH